MKHFVVFWFVLHICLVYCITTNHVKGYKVECRFSEKFIINGSCSLKPINRRSAAFSAYGYLIHPLNSIQTSIKIFRRYNTFVPFPINIKVNACDYFSGRKKSIIYDLVKMMLDKSSNINHTCPYSGEIIIKNLELITKRIENFTTIMPEGIYRVDANFYMGDTSNFVAFGQGFFEVKEEEI